MRPTTVSPMKKIVLQAVRGFCMGSADIVPGVSGGTVALVLGIYHELVANIKTGADALGRFVKADVKGGIERLKAVEWLFLIPLLVGILAAVAALSHLIEQLLEDHPIQMAALFLGLVGGSVVVAWQLLERRDVARIGVLVGVAIVTFFLLGLRTTTSEADDVIAPDRPLWAFFLAGALAICAMILPGISGSFLLVMIGMYASVLAAVNDRDLLAVGVFVVGCVIGLALFSQLLHWALNTHYDTVMAALVGLMLGSVRVLWPWPGGTNTTELGAPGDPWVLPVVLAVGGFALVVGFSTIATRLEQRTEHDLVEDVQAT